MSDRARQVWLLAASGLLMVVGSLGAWVEAPVATFYGFDGPGWVGAAFGTCVIVLAWLQWRAAVRWRFLISTAIGVLGMVTACLLLLVATQIAGRVTGLWDALLGGWHPALPLAIADVSAGWAVYVLLVASGALIVTSLVAFLRGSPRETIEQPPSDEPRVGGPRPLLGIRGESEDALL